MRCLVAVSIFGKIAHDCGANLKSGSHQACGVLTKHPPSPVTGIVFGEIAYDCGPKDVARGSYLSTTETVLIACPSNQLDTRTFEQMNVSPPGIYVFA